MPRFRRTLNHLALPLVAAMVLTACPPNGIVARPPTPPPSESTTATTNEAGNASLRLPSINRIIQVTVQDETGRPVPGMRVLASTDKSHLFVMTVDPRAQHHPGFIFRPLAELSGATAPGSQVGPQIDPITIGVLIKAFKIISKGRTVQHIGKSIGESIRLQGQGLVQECQRLAGNAFAKIGAGIAGLLVAKVFPKVPDVKTWEDLVTAVPDIAAGQWIETATEAFARQFLVPTEVYDLCVYTNRQFPEGRIIRVNVPQPAMAAAGGTWRSDVAVIRDGTAILLAFSRGLAGAAVATVTGPAAWNGGRPWNFNIGSVSTGAWRWNELLPSTPVTGQYMVTVTDGQQTFRASFNIDARRSLPPPMNVHVSSVSPTTVTVSWSPVVGAVSYLVSVAEDCGADLCPSIRWVYVSAAATSATVTNVPFVSGRRYFVSVRSFNANMLQSPPSLPSQFNIGHTPSAFFRAAPGSAQAAFPKLMQDVPVRLEPVGR